MHPDDLVAQRGEDIGIIIGPQVEGTDGENTFYYNQNNIGSGYDTALQYGLDIPIERGMSYSALRKMEKMDDDKLQQYIQEEEAEQLSDRFEDREDYQNNSELIAEGNEIFNSELKRYNKAHQIKKQTITYADY